MNLNEICSNYDTSRFQKALGEFIIAEKLETIVETGMGISTICILLKMEENNFGKLFSIDPNPKNINESIIHERFRLIKQTSDKCLVDLYLETGPWDLFLHDSDHDIFCQTFEYEFAWACLREGGCLLSDDTVWGGHKAWDNFCFSKGLTSSKLGNIEKVQKYGKAINKNSVVDIFKQSIAKATHAEVEWYKSGHTNSPFDYSRPNPIN